MQSRTELLRSAEFKTHNGQTIQIVLEERLEQGWKRRYMVYNANLTTSLFAGYEFFSDWCEALHEFATRYRNGGYLLRIGQKFRWSKSAYHDGGLETITAICSITKVEHRTEGRTLMEYTVDTIESVQNPGPRPSWTKGATLTIANDFDRIEWL